MNQNQKDILQYRVWAPLPKQVEIEIGGHRNPMKSEKAGSPSRSSEPFLSEGWWTATIDTAAASGDYGFVLDGEGPFPDPRSPWQPNGVHGLSRSVNHDGFNWSDAEFNAAPLSQAVIYELHVGTFTPAGTFKAAIEKLDYLAQLGVTHLELMPVNEFSGSHGWGYDGVNLFAPHHAYGTPDDLKNLVNACHQRGLAVLLDVVYNHLGPTGNYLGKFAPYFTDRYHTPWGKALNFDDAHSDEVRRFFCDNALMWLRDYHFDGLRLDAVHAIFDASAMHILEQLQIEVEQLSAQQGRRLVLIPESDLNNPRLISPRSRGGYQLDAQWSDDFHHALHSVLTGERNGYYEDFGTLTDLAKALRNAYVYDGRYSMHRKRCHGRPPTGLDGYHFLGYAQTHDQVGNRAQGERLSQLVSIEQLKIAAALVFTSPFVPMLFQGEEWGASTPFQYFTDHAEPELADAVRKGRRSEFAAFGWKPEEVPDPQARETFERSKLNWAEINRAPHADILGWHKRLIQLRRQESAFTDGRRDLVETRFDEKARWLTVERGPLTVAVNFADSPLRISVPAGKQRVLLSSTESLELADRAALLPRLAVAVLKQSGLGS